MIAKLSQTLPMALLLLVCACDASTPADTESRHTVPSSTVSHDTMRSHQDDVFDSGVDGALDNAGDNALSSDTSSVSGLWNASSSGDTLYVYIDERGHWYGYDYAADASGDGNNCHYIFGPYRLDALDGHRFIWNDSLDSREITLVRDGQSLHYGDADGTWTLPALDGIDIEDLVVCGKVL